MAQQSVRVLLARVDDVLRHSLQHIIEADPRFEVSAVDGSLERVANAAQTAMPDAVLLAPPLSDASQGSIVETCRSIKALLPDARVIALMALHEPARDEALRRAGAADILLMQFDPSALYEALAAPGGGAPSPPP